jgi:hypothetical protein
MCCFGGRFLQIKIRFYLYFQIALLTRDIDLVGLWYINPLALGIVEPVHRLQLKTTIRKYRYCIWHSKILG